MTTNNILYIIPARGGSKGIPHKNIKFLAGKPLICYSIDVARELTSDDNICVSTDDEEIIKVVENYGLKVPFIRPVELATDTATTNDVILHAIDFYEKQGKKYNMIVLLQPTSPLRTVKHVEDALILFNEEVDMVVSVKESKATSVICCENEDGFLELSINKNARRRQDVKNYYYEYNGAIYIFSVEKIKKLSLAGFVRKKKYVMDEKSSVDIDSEFDWIISEKLINKKS